MSFVKDRLPTWPDYADREGLQILGRGKWRNVLCVFHDDSTPSMRVNVETGGWCCMSCGAKGGDVLAHHMERHGLDFIEACKALGAWQDDGKPGSQFAKVATLSARDAMAVISFELNVLIVVIGDIRRGLIPNDLDWQRCLVAAGRIQKIAGDYT